MAYTLQVSARDYLRGYVIARIVAKQRAGSLSHRSSCNRHQRTYCARAAPFSGSMLCFDSYYTQRF